MYIDFRALDSIPFSLRGMPCGISVIRFALASSKNVIDDHGAMEPTAPVASEENEEVANGPPTEAVTNHHCTSPASIIIPPSQCHRTIELMMGQSPPRSSNYTNYQKDVIYETVERYHAGKTGLHMRLLASNLSVKKGIQQLEGSELTP